MAETDLFDNFKNIMPGDFLTDDIEIKNTTPYSTVNIYLRVNPHDEQTNPLSPEVAEHETIASMTDFLSHLSLNVYNNNELIYSASPDQTDTLSDYVFLGEFNNEDASTLHLELSIPSELNDTYAHRLGEVDWVLLTEESTSSDTSAPDTGLFSEAPSYLLPTLIFIPIFVLISLLVYRQKKKSH